MDEIPSSGVSVLARPVDVDAAERRADPRHFINGPALLIDGHGTMHHVTLVDLSAGGARLTRPAFAELFVGVPLTLAGQAMPWERACVVVGLGPDRVHVRFA